MARASIFFALVALTAGLAGCGEGRSDYYDLTISSTEGGDVTTPGEGIYTYDDGKVVNLIATPDAGYYFVNWTGDVDTIGDSNAATTTITCYDDYSIIANFAQSIPMVATSNRHTVGLRADGMVLALGNNEFGQCNVADWTGITQVATGYYNTVGLRIRHSSRCGMHGMD